MLHLFYLTNLNFRFGFFFMALGFGLFIDLPPTTNWTKIIIFQIVAGLGVGPNFQAPLIALQSNIPQRDIASATATFGFIRNLSTSISVVIGGVIYQNEMNKKAASLEAALGPELAGQLSGGSAGASVGIVTALPAAQRTIAQNAFYKSLRTMWIVYVAFAVLGLIISFFIASNHLSKEHEETKTGLVEEEAKRKEVMEKKRMSKEVMREEKRAEKEARKSESAEKRRENGELVPKEDV
jgi:hypothetical protein